MADDAAPTIDKTSVDTETAAKSWIGRASNAYSVSLFAHGLGFKAEATFATRCEQQLR